MADISANCTDAGHVAVGPFIIGVVITPTTADNTDTIDLGTLLGLNKAVTIKFAKGMRENGSSIADELVSWATDTLTIRGSTSDKEREIFYVATST